MTLLLAADIGGTKSHLCLAHFVSDAKQLNVLHEKIYASTSYGNAEQLLESFFSEYNIQSTDIHLMCLALPGIVNQGSCGLTNLDWHLEQTKLQQYFGIAHVVFINDFQAAALGVLNLQANDFLTLNQGTPQQTGIKVVTGAGTGLGLAWLHHDTEKYHSNATEGGHIDFAPTTPQQIGLLEALMKVFKHVSYERLLSGEGLQHIYQFITEMENSPPSAAEISQLAAQADVAAQQTLELFIEIYGAYIGNLALLYQPSGGIYIAGGIAAKHPARMQSRTFKDACLQKGRMRKLVEKIPIHLITNERLGLQGALWHAWRYLNQETEITLLSSPR